jgi:hypothetical protein
MIWNLDPSRHEVELLSLSLDTYDRNNGAWIWVIYGSVLDYALNICPSYDLSSSHAAKADASVLIGRHDPYILRCFHLKLPEQIQISKDIVLAQEQYAWAHMTHPIHWKPQGDDWIAEIDGWLLWVGGVHCQPGYAWAAMNDQNRTEKTSWSTYNLDEAKRAAECYLYHELLFKFSRKSSAIDSSRGVGSR